MAALQIQTELRWKENQPLRDLGSPPQAHCSPGNANRTLTSLPLRRPGEDGSRNSCFQVK